MRVIAVINKKGGVSKTTTTANIGHALALQGHRVTLIDFDPQGHLSVYLGAREMSGAGVDDVLLGTTDLKTVSIRIRENLTLIQPGKKLDYIEQLLDSRLQVSKRLKRSIDELASENDYLLIDCPPSSGLLAIFALYSCHQVLIPVNGDYLSLHGVSQFLDTLKSVEKAIGHDIDFQLAMTRYYPRRRLARSIVKKLLHYFPGRVLATPVREASAITEAPGFGKTIFEYAPQSYGSDDYRSLATDLEVGRVM